jgi:hypothetical protein
MDWYHNNHTMSLVHLTLTLTDYPSNPDSLARARGHTRKGWFVDYNSLRIASQANKQLRDRPAVGIDSRGGI